MFRPFLLVGLGGSGGKTLRYVKRDVMKRLQAAGWTKPDMPTGWQFLHIDTPTIADGQELNKFVPPLNPDEYVGLVGDGVDFDTVANQLDNAPNLTDELVGWRIDPAGLKVPIGVGAGQFRAVGRTVAMAHGAAIRRRLQNSFDKISTPDSYSELREVYSVVEGGAASPSNPQPHVIVVSSLAGGTGAGLLMNVCDLINELDECEGVMAMLYTPEVFGSISGAGGGVFPNSLAAISEVLNGYWWHASLRSLEQGSVQPRKNRDLVNAGAARPMASGGPNYPFLIGMKNAEGAAFGTDTQLFGMVGAAISTWMTDIAVQDRLIAYQYTNWQNSAGGNIPHLDALTNAGDEVEVGIGAFQALGVARLSIGLDYFERYTTERLALDAAKFLANAHMSSDDAVAFSQRQNTEDPRALARGVAELHLPSFLKRTHLAEAGPDDEVIQAIDPRADVLKREAEDSARRLSEIGTGGNASASEWEEKLLYAVQRSLEGFAKAHLPLIHQQLEEWVDTVPDQVLAEVESFIADHGIRVTSAMLRQASDYFLSETGVVHELRQEASDRQGWSSEAQVRSGIAGQLQALGSKIPPDHQALEEALQEAFHYGFFLAEAQIREQAASLLESFANKFLHPLALALEQHANNVDEQLLSEAVNWAPWLEGPPPTELIPPPSEVTLIEPEDFHPTFLKLLDESFPESRNEDTRRIDIRRAIVSGSFLREDDAPKSASKFAIELRAQWSPGTTVLPTRPQTQSDATFRVSLTPTELKERASAWMRRPNTPFQKLMSETLRTYLQPDGQFKGSVSEQEYAERQRRFIPKLKQTLQSSAPLVDLDTRLLSQVHPKMAENAFSRVVSNLPFRNHAIAGQVESMLLTEFDGQSAKVEQMMNTDATLEYINVVSTLAAPSYPLVFESLLRPVSSEWVRNSQTSAQRQQFWLRRRARRLEEFIPAPQETILAMCRGWFLGSILGIVDRNPNPAVRVGRENDTPVSFPSVLLTDPRNSPDLLAVHLESLALAYLEVSQLGDLGPLQPYIQLRMLGTSFDMGQQTSLYEYPQFGSMIEQWVKTGEIPRGMVIAEPLIGSLGDDGNPMTEDGRLDKLEELLTKTENRYRTDYQELQHQWSKNKSKLGDKPSWPGIYDQTVEALDQLLGAVRHHRDNRSSFGGLDL